MFSIEEPEVYKKSRFELKSVSSIKIAGVNVLDFGVLMEDELLGQLCAVDRSVVPSRRKSFIVIRVKMSEKVNEGVFGEGLGKIEVIDNNVSVGDDAGHL